MQIPFGVQNNVARSQFNGYSTVYEVVYSSMTTSSIINNIRNSCTATSTLCYGCYSSSNSNNLLTVACGRCLDVTNNTVKNSPNYINGVYWYYTESTSIGFSSLNDITQNTCDNNNGVSPGKKICWHLEQNVGGWRCGSATTLNYDTTYYKIIFRN